MQITRQTAQEFRAKVTEALKRVATEMNLNLDPIGTIRFDPSEVRCKIVFKSSAPSINIASDDPRKDIPSWWLRKSVKVRRTVYHITDYKPSRPKYPFCATTDKGRKFKLSWDFLKAGVIIK